jgi:asparaginyl-tRNA synthetase
MTIRKGLVTIREVLTEVPLEAEIEVAGWVRTFRQGKKVGFIQLNDGSCFQDLQIVVEKERFPAHVLNAIETGACIRVSGKVVPSQGSKQARELLSQTILLYGPADNAIYPLQKKEHTLEFLREIAHFRPRTRFFSAILRIRHTISYHIHHYFHSHGFYYIHTPIITSSDCEGAGQLFRVTTLSDSQLKALAEEKLDPSQDFFGKPSYLTVSGQLTVEPVALALSKVYTFGPTFRAEHSNTTRHLAEFWMIEPEMAFYDLEDNMELAEDLLKYLVAQVLEHHSDDLHFLAQFYDVPLHERLEGVFREPFIRISYTEAIRHLEKENDQFQFPVQWGDDLQTEHERYLTEVLFKKPVIVYDYPKAIKAFYMRQNEDGKTVAAMDVLFPHIGEVIGGSQREERYDRLKQRIIELGLPLEAYEWYLETRRFGSAPHSGFGLGLERFVQFCTGATNIRDVILFPRYYGNIHY